MLTLPRSINTAIDVRHSGGRMCRPPESTGTASAAKRSSSGSSGSIVSNAVDGGSSSSSIGKDSGDRRPIGSASGARHSIGRVEKMSRLERLKGLPESLAEGVCELPRDLDEMACTPAFREALQEEAATVLDLTRLLERSPLPLFLRIHESKAATTRVLVLTAAPGARRLDRTTRNALKLGWPRVTAIKIFSHITSLADELQYKIWMPRDCARYFPNLRSISYVAHSAAAGYFREMLHPMGRQPQAAPRAVVLRASQRHMDVLGLSADLMRYMAHANFLLRSLALTIRSEGHYTDYAFTVIRAVLLTDVAAPESLRLNVDSTDLLYKVAESRTLRVVAAGAPDGGRADGGRADGGDEVAFSKPSVRELALRFREIGKLGIPFAARHFPRLERLVLHAHADVGHPALENTLYGCMFLEPWARLRRVQLAHINDTLVQLLASSCPALAELVVFNAATHAELMAKHSFDIHRTLIPLPSMPSMRFTPKSLHYLLTRFAHLRVLDLNYPLYVDPLARAHDIDASLAASLARATAAQQQPRQLRYLSLPFIPLTAHGIGGILGAFPRLVTLEVRLAATPSGAGRPASAAALASRRRRQQLLARVRGAVGGKENAAAAAAGAGAGAAELSALWVWSDWASAATTLAQVLGLFTQAGRRVPRVYVPYVAGVEAASEVETRLIMQHMHKEMPWAAAHRFEYNVADYYT